MKDPLQAAALAVSWFVSRRVVRPIAALSVGMVSWRPELAAAETADFERPRRLPPADRV